MILNRNNWFLIAFILLLVSCDKDEDFGPQGNDNDQNQNRAENRAVFVLNEGNFQAANASIDEYDLEKEVIDNQIFQDVNEENLGDVGQSLFITHDTLGIIMNNSSKIVLMNINSREKLSEIKIDQSYPRYAEHLSGSEWLVSDIYRDKLYIVNIRTGDYSSVACSGWTETLIKSADEQFIFIHNKTSNNVDRFEIETKTISQSINSTNNVSSIVKADDRICAITKIGIQEIYPQQQNITSFPDTLSTLRSSYSESTNQIILLSNNVYSYGLINDRFDTLISSSRNFYGLQADSINGDIYLTDAKDYSQSGELLRYSKTGELLDIVTTGVIPQHIEIAELND
ncbi:hypothetical protein [Salibacter halophilus]|uniref:Uncharacterized protein n=1 Tax=Salibacter halophilus TaxID=1803916 RepID=A0A6N6M6D3_9FLAO|nr:hypothetical protein [Salibacter halophilus]KAB1065167.1 hypothetical protein F3059_04230 [Salibacter halophilus]